VTFSELCEGCTDEEVRELEAFLYLLRLRTRLAKPAGAHQANGGGDA
jgi:hypothetical protein